MNLGKSCMFYRDVENNSHFGKGIGCCDLGVIWTICDGDMRFCEHPEELIRCLHQLWLTRKTFKMDSTPRSAQSF